MLSVHTFITWFLIILVYPLLGIGYETLSASAGIRLPGIVIDYILFSIGAFFVSLPSFFIACFFLKMIVNASFTIPARFCLWMLTLSVLAFLEILIPDLINFIGIFQPVVYLLPLLAVTCVTLFRYRQFVKLFYLSQPVDHETQLV